MGSMLKKLFAKLTGGKVVYLVHFDERVQTRIARKSPRSSSWFHTYSYPFVPDSVVVFDLENKNSLSAPPYVDYLVCAEGIFSPSPGFRQFARTKDPGSVASTLFLSKFGNG